MSWCSISSWLSVPESCSNQVIGHQKVVKTGERARRCWNVVMTEFARNAFSWRNNRS